MPASDAPPPSRSDEPSRIRTRAVDGEPITTGRDKPRRAGRLMVRREAVDRQMPSRAGTADERLLRRSRTAFLDSDPWRTLRIQAEFVEGFDALAGVGPAVTVFGSARVAEGEPVYEQARELGRLLAEAGLTVITGGGPGVMAAANRGASRPAASRSAATSSCRTSSGSTRGWTWVSSSATSSSERRCS